MLSFAHEAEQGIPCFEVPATSARHPQDYCATKTGAAASSLRSDASLPTPSPARQVTAPKCPAEPQLYTSLKSCFGMAGRGRISFVLHCSNLNLRRLIFQGIVSNSRCTVPRKLCQSVPGHGSFHGRPGAHCKRWS